MDDFATIRLRKTVIEKFKGYSKKTSPSYSETLDFMIAFFEDTGLSPYDTMNNPILSCTISLNKRTDAVAAILRNIEKTQLVPAREMLESLFEEKVKEEKPRLVEKKFMDNSKDKKIINEATVPKIRYERLGDKMNSVMNDFEYVLDKVKVVKSSFGKDYLRLELTKEELVKYRRALKKT
tara:strand:+ start:185 stop:724 length:540 start_codon:yes stop_codon:yes gene_type:complete